MRSQTAPVVHVGGPERPANALRNLLEERIEAVPGGGSIDWMTYYFRDERVAEALVRAHRRGVSVRVCVERRPRQRSANDRVIDILANPDGIGSGLTAVRHLLPLHLHTKLYAFSHPEPHALVGSFNPSGSDAEDAEMIEQIGDQDRGHNLLVELREPGLVRALVGRVAELHSDKGSFRWGTSADAIRCNGTETWFFPRVGANPLLTRLNALGPGTRLRIASSHVRDPMVVRKLAELVARGVDVTLLTGHTIRRTPPRVCRYLVRHGVEVHRFTHPARLPMHSKFMLADGADRWASFGSYNLTLTSRWLNHELLMFSSDPQLWSQLDRCWNEILASEGAPDAY